MFLKIIFIFFVIQFLCNGTCSGKPIAAARVFEKDLKILADSCITFFKNNLKPESLKQAKRYIPISDIGDTTKDYVIESMADYLHDALTLAPRYFAQPPFENEKELSYKKTMALFKMIFNETCDSYGCEHYFFVVVNSLVGLFETNKHLVSDIDEIAAPLKSKYHQLKFSDFYGFVRLLSQLRSHASIINVVDIQNVTNRYLGFLSKTHDGPTSLGTDLLNGITNANFFMRLEKKVLLGDLFCVDTVRAFNCDATNGVPQTLNLTRLHTQINLFKIYFENEMLRQDNLNSIFQANNPAPQEKQEVEQLYNAPSPVNFVLKNHLGNWPAMKRYAQLYSVPSPGKFDMKAQSKYMPGMENYLLELKNHIRLSLNDLLKSKDFVPIANFVEYFRLYEEFLNEYESLVFK